MQHYPILIGRTGGNYHLFNGTDHLALYARTGSGKGVSFVIPNIFAWAGSLVVLDIKGEAFRATAGHREAMGQEVYLFDPASETGRSHRWDPFAVVQRGSIARFRQIARQANLLFPEHDQIGSSGNNQKFWDDIGRQTYGSVSTILAETPGEPITMGRIADLFARDDGHEIVADMIAAGRKAGRPLSQNAVSGVSGYIGSEKKFRDEVTYHRLDQAADLVRSANCRGNIGQRLRPSRSAPQADDHLCRSGAGQHTPHAPPAAAVLGCLRQPEHRHDAG